MRAIAALLLLTACGARTGLLIEREEIDGGMDAGMADGGRDAGRDGGPDATVCVPGEVALEAGEIDVVFVIDRSGSMLAGYDGDTPAAGEPTRWELLEESMSEALVSFDDPRISVGAKFFPSRTRRGEPDLCAVNDRLDARLGPLSSGGILAEFRAWEPSGGTPLGPAIDVAVRSLSEAGEDRAQFIVVAPDGAPTCDRDPVGHTLRAIEDAHGELGIDVLVVGIASTEPEVALLDMFAVAGGRPLDGERRFYDARDPDLLTVLLSDVTRDLAQCVFAVPIPPGPEDVIEVLVAGASTPRDEARLDGWDWTNESRAQLGLFGPTCERARASGGAVRAIITCR
jgi:hypothetical protein